MNMVAKLIETKGKGAGLGTVGGRGGGAAGATLGVPMAGGTGLAWEKGMTSSDVANIAQRIKSTDYCRF